MRRERPERALTRPGTLTIRQIAVRLGTCERSPLGWILIGLRLRSGERVRLPAERVGRKWLVTEEHLAAFREVIQLDAMEAGGKRRQEVEAADRLAAEAAAVKLPAGGSDVKARAASARANRECAEMGW